MANVLVNQGFQKIYFELLEEKVKVENNKISDLDILVFSFIEHECRFKRNGGWCGLSNEKIGESLINEKKDSSISKSISRLEKSGLIEIVNGDSGERKIFINADNFIKNIPVEKQDIVQNNEYETKLIEQEAKIKELEKRLENVPSQKISFVGLELTKSKLITEKQYMEECEMLNKILLNFFEFLEFDRGQLNKCFFYWNEMKKDKIKKPVGYILKCISDYKIGVEFNLN